MQEKVEIYSKPDHSENEAMDVIENHKLSMETLNSDLQKCKDDAAKGGAISITTTVKGESCGTPSQEEQQKLDTLENNLASARHIREE